MIEKQLKNGQMITIRKCTLDDLSEILALQDEVIQTLTTTSFLQPLSEEEFSHILSDHGTMLGAFHKDELIAFRALLIPQVNEADHLGEDAGIPKEAWSKVIYSEISNVSPKFRGNGLQKILGEQIFQGIDSERFAYVCATVAPFNIASLLDKFTLGMKIVALKEKYEGLTRYILLKDFKEVPKKALEEVAVPMEDIITQQKLLVENWQGIAIKNLDDKWFVVYEKY